jgi:hypothetical protein
LRDFFEFELIARSEVGAAAQKTALYGDLLIAYWNRYTRRRSSPNTQIDTAARDEKEQRVMSRRAALTLLKLGNSSLAGFQGFASRIS